jgi:hypothetical protein
MCLVKKKYSNHNSDDDYFAARHTCKIWNWSTECDLNSVEEEDCVYPVRPSTFTVQNFQAKMSVLV